MLIVYTFERYFITSIPDRKDFYVHGSKLDEKVSFIGHCKELDLKIPHRPENEIS